MNTTIDDVKITVIPTIFKKIEKDDVIQISPRELEEIVRSARYENTGKKKRPAVSQSSNEGRPVQKLPSYAYWSGFQPIDIDIKCAKAAVLAKPFLAHLLFKFPWAKSIALSTSGTGLHIYTYTRPLHAPGGSLMADMAKLNEQKDYYLDTYEYKLSVVWKCLVLACQALMDNGIEEKTARQAHPVLNTGSIAKNAKAPNVVDVTSCRISQPLNITSDRDMAINDGFVYKKLNRRIASDIYKNSDPKYQINRLKEKFDAIRDRKPVGNDAHAGLSAAPADIFDGSCTKSMAGVTPCHYNNEERYRMAYTLVNMYGIKGIHDEGYAEILDMFMLMCSGSPKYAKEKREYRAIFRSAAARHKEGSAHIIWWAVKELRETHGIKIEVENTKAINKIKELVTEHNTGDKIKSYVLGKIDLDNMAAPVPDLLIKCKPAEYIGDFKDRIVAHWEMGVNMLIAKPGAGKTEFVKQLAADGERVLLVQPFTSLISAKIEEGKPKFACFYGDRKVNFEESPNVCTTFDKFAHMDPADIAVQFDYIVIDESHLLTSSSYRDNTPGDVVDKIKLLDKKIVCMTGTPIAEHLFMRPKTTTVVDREETRTKAIKFVPCHNDYEKITAMGKHIAKAIKNGQKVLFPTNKGNVYAARISGAVSTFLGRKVRYKYYKKDNALYEFVEDINREGTLGKIELLFSTNYLSVGIDINDTDKFHVLYDESFTAQEIEQFNCRLRNLDIQSYFYFSTHSTKGEAKNIALYENLDISNTEDELLECDDVYKLHNKGAGFGGMYDFFKWVFHAPYFIKNKTTNDVTLHDTSYKLHKFEEKWRAWATQIVVIKNVLEGMGYIIEYENADDQNEIDIQAALGAAKKESADYKKKRNNSIGAFLSIISDQKSFNAVGDMPNKDVVDSDRFQLVKSGTGGGPGIKLLVGDRPIFNQWRAKLRQLGKYYKAETALQIVHEECYSEKSNAYSYAALERVVSAAKLFDHGHSRTLEKSNVYILDYLFNRVFDVKNNVTSLEINEEQISDVCRDMAMSYIRHSIKKPRSVGFGVKLQAAAKQLFDTITARDGKARRIKTLRRFDSDFVYMQNSLTKILSEMFVCGIADTTVKYNAIQEGVLDAINKNVLTGNTPSLPGAENLNILPQCMESVKKINTKALAKIQDSDYKFKKTIRPGARANARPAKPKEKTISLNKFDNDTLGIITEFADALQKNNT